jgi:hypothetical protein
MGLAVIVANATCHWGTAGLVAVLQWPMQFSFKMAAIRGVGKMFQTISLKFSTNCTFFLWISVEL